MEISKVKEISDSLGYTPQKIEVLSQEASDRKYFRLILDTHDYKEFTENWYKYEHNSKLRNRTEPGSNDPCSVIFCFLDPKVGSNKRFVELSNHVHKHPQSIFNGISFIGGLIPKVYAFEDKIGVTIQEDFYESFLEKFPDGFEHLGMDSFPVCDYAFLSLVHFVKLDFPDLKNLSSEDLEAQMKRFEDYFLSDLLEINLANFGSQKENLQNLIEETIQNLSLQPWVNCHQDFEVRNLMQSPVDSGGGGGIIDFQDTCKGPIGIDLAGIYIDHYNFNFTFAHLKCFDDQSEINRIIAEYGFAGIEDQETIYEYAVWGGIQRNLRILGTLSNLYLQNGRTFRLPDLPLILNNLIMIIPDNHQELKDFLRTEVFNLLNKKLEAIL